MKVILIQAIVLVSLLTNISQAQIFPRSHYSNGFDFFSKNSGFRIGGTYLDKDKITIGETEYKTGHFIMQFGYQKEHLISNTNEKGEFYFANILLFGGLEKNLFFPSWTGLIGLRTNSNFQFGIGPNISLAGISLTLSGGKNFEWGNANVPLDLAVIFSKNGLRISLLTGLLF